MLCTVRSAAQNALCPGRVYADNCDERCNLTKTVVRVKPILAHSMRTVAVSGSQPVQVWAHWSKQAQKAQLYFNAAPIQSRRSWCGMLPDPVVTCCYQWFVLYTHVDVRDAIKNAKATTNKLMRNALA
jgi:hypothetical protein